MVLTRMVSGFGAEAVAVQRVGGQIESVSWNTADGFGTALNAFIGQNYGAGKMDRVKKRIQSIFVQRWNMGNLYYDHVCFSTKGNRGDFLP